MLEVRVATRYVTPLREGGSLPGLMEADDLGTYVVKFHGAGQGRKVLAAEVVCASLARALDLPVPDLVAIELDPVLAPAEPDEEVQDLLRRSAGLNLGVDYLPGALDFDPTALAAADAPPPGHVLWFDAFTQNVDRTWKNPNMLHWHGRLMLIDHGAALVFHHDWTRAAGSADRPFAAADHALVRLGPDVRAAAADLAPRVTDDVLAAAVADVPDGWLVDEPGFTSADEVRAAYVGRLRARLDATDIWLPTLAEAVVTAAAAPEPSGGRTRSGRPAWLTGRPGARPRGAP